MLQHGLKFVVVGWVGSNTGTDVQGEVRVIWGVLNVFVSLREHRLVSR